MLLNIFEGEFDQCFFFSPIYKNVRILVVKVARRDDHERSLDQVLVDITLQRNRYFKINSFGDLGTVTSRVQQLISNECGLFEGMNKSINL